MCERARITHCVWRTTFHGGNRDEVAIFPLSRGSQMWCVHMLLATAEAHIRFAICNTYRISPNSPTSTWKKGQENRQISLREPQLFRSVNYVMICWHVLRATQNWRSFAQNLRKSSHFRKSRDAGKCVVSEHKEHVEIELFSFTSKRRESE